MLLSLAPLAVAQTPCYTAPVTAISVPAVTRTSTFLIYRGASCNWFLPPAGNVISNVPWITIRQDIWWGYSGDGVFAFDTAVNLGAPRTGTITAAGLTFTVRQNGASDTIPVTGQAVPALASLDSIITGDMKGFGAPGGALAVTYQGRLVYARGFGYADLTTLELVQPDSLFRLASVSKLITMAAIGNLEKNGSLTPSTKAFAVLNNLTPPSGATVVDLRWYDITIDELINHTAGFIRNPTDRALDYNYLVSATAALQQTMPGNNTTVIRYALGKPLDYTPGSPPSPCPDCYSNFGYQILGRVIEKVTGSTYENYIRSIVMAPLGITRTRAGRSYSDQIAPGEVKYYTNSSEMWHDSVFADKPGPALATYGSYAYENADSFGGMIANTMDILRFYNYWLNWGPGSGFYGSLPGTNTGVFTLKTDNDVRYSFLFNYRSDIVRAGTGADLEVAVHDDLEQALSKIASWPAGDLFPPFTGANPLCTYTVTPATPSFRPPRRRSVTVTASRNDCQWNAVSDASWITLEHASGAGTGLLNLTAASYGSGPARSAPIYVAGQTLAVMQTSSAAPTFTSAGVTNGASFLSGATPGGIVTLFGTNLSQVSGIAMGATLPLVRALQGTAVTVGGVQAPLFAVVNQNGNEQINLQIPYEAAGQSSVAVLVTNNGLTSASITVPILAAQPGVFAYGGGNGVVLHSADNALVTSANPAARGEVVVIYATGLGPVSNAPTTGAPAGSGATLAQTTTQPAVTFGGVKSNVQFSGLTPGFVGLNQINAMVPPGASAGSLDLVVTIESQSSAAVKVSVK